MRVRPYGKRGKPVVVALITPLIERACAVGRVKIRGGCLFVFDPGRRAIFLVAGDKAERRQWEAWYPKAIKEADARYEDYLEALQKEERDR